MGKTDATTSFGNELNFLNLKAKVLSHVKILVIRERHFVNKLYHVKMFHSFQ